MTAKDLAKLPTLCVAQCCSLKLDNGFMRVWLCRVGGGVSVERLNPEGWRVTAGSCTDTSLEVP